MQEKLFLLHFIRKVLENFTKMNTIFMLTYANENYGVIKVADFRIAMEFLKLFDETMTSELVDKLVETVNK